MEHVVFFPSADGAPAFRRVASLEDAVRFVEHLRNVEDISDFSVQALTPVPLAMRAYYKVQVPDQEMAGAAEPAPAADAPVEPAPEPVVGATEEPQPVVAQARVHGQKSLGFFAR